MIKKIYKYKLDAVPQQTIELPMLAKPLKVGLQAVNEYDCLWESYEIVLWAIRAIRRSLSVTPSTRASRKHGVRPCVVHSKSLQPIN